jgi:hypothetical protein
MHLSREARYTGAVLERRRKQYRIVYELLNENPRVDYNEVAEALGVERKAAAIIVKEAFEHGYIVGPHLRKRSYKNFLEYVYFVRASDPAELYDRFMKDNRISYHAKTIGFSDLWVVAKEKMEIDGEIMVGGPRSDYWLPTAPDCPWEHSINIMWDMVEAFDPRNYSQKGYLQTRWDKVIKWNERDEILFQELKYEVRKPLEPLTKEKYHIGCGGTYKWLQRLPECCTIATSYFPEGISAYDPYLFMFETEYEDFVIDLFSQFPVSVLFFKVSNKLLLYVHLKRQLLRTVGNQAVEFNRLHIPLLIRELLNKGVITNDSYGIVEYFWAKDI